MQTWAFRNSDFNQAAGAHRAKYHFIHRLLAGMLAGGSVGYGYTHIPHYAVTKVVHKAVNG
jgi:hypothetical protein